MSVDELDGYAKALGIDVRAGKTAEEKAKIISERRGRVATVTVLGMQLDVPVKRAHDKRVSELLDKDGRTTEDIDEAFRIILGDEQLDALRLATTDDDGTVDEAALSYAYNAILGSDELKNF